MAFPGVDPVGPFGAALPDAVLVIASVVAPFAAAADASGVSRSTLDALAAAGLMEPRDAVVQREAAELIAGADASVWFCWTQHFSSVSALAGAVESAACPGVAALRERYLPRLVSGAALGAVAVAHLRRPGARNPLAVRVDGGWRIAGTLDWVTSWDIADVLLLWAGDGQGRFVAGLVPLDGSVAGLSVGPPLSLLAMGGTHTRPVVLESVFLADSSVVAVVPADAWHRADAVKTAMTSPAAFGIARGAIAELWSLGLERDDAALLEAAGLLRDACRSVRASAYALADEAAAGGLDESRFSACLSVRAEAVSLAMRAASAVVAARAGAGMYLGQSAERRVREAQFIAVQAQTRASRDALLRLLSGGR